MSFTELQKLIELIDLTLPFVRHKIWRDDGAKIIP